MRINFNDDSFIEFVSVNNKVSIIMGARDGKNHLKTIINSAEVTAEELSELLSDITFK